MSNKLLLPVLPCNPCPHKGACCYWGTYLLPQEKNAIQAAHGDVSIRWDDEDKEWRTSIVNGKCFFLAENGACSIHEETYYPSVCKLFPYEDVDGGDYKYDLSICPEMKDV